MSSKPTILIVDDEIGILALLALIFEGAGYGVRTAADGLEAMELCRAESLDAVISDARMPGFSGHDLARWLAEQRPATRFILMTGWDTGCDDCSIAGRCHIVVKPFLPRDVVSAVDAILACGEKPATFGAT
jgi:DNA-binding NtrC family response regulator